MIYDHYVSRFKKHESPKSIHLVRKFSDTIPQIRMKAMMRITKVIMQRHLSAAQYNTMHNAMLRLEKLQIWDCIWWWRLINHFDRIWNCTSPTIAAHCIALHWKNSRELSVDYKWNQTAIPDATNITSMCTHMPAADSISKILQTKPGIDVQILLVEGEKQH